MGTHLARWTVVPGKSRDNCALVLLITITCVGVAACSGGHNESDLTLEDDPLQLPRRNQGEADHPKGSASSGSRNAPGSTNEPVVPANPSSSNPPPPAAQQPPPPNIEGFLTIDVRYPLGEDLVLTQCIGDAKTRLVWKTVNKQRDEYSRWADPKYVETPTAPCGTMSEGHYPIVFSALAADDLPIATWVARCVAPGKAHVYRTSGVLDGHPIATFQYPETYPACP